MGSTIGCGPPSLQSTKVSQEPILIAQNEGEKFLHTTCLYAIAFGIITPAATIPLQISWVPGSQQNAHEFLLRIFQIPDQED